MLYCSVNGQSTNQVLVGDRGLSFGDGVFTTAKINQGKVQLLPNHLKRLTNACAKLGIAFTDVDSLSKEINQIAQSFSLAVLKVVITAGHGGRGYSRQGILKPTVIITVSEYPDVYQEYASQGISLVTSKVKLSRNAQLAGLKHLNRLEQVLIRSELDQIQAQDAIVLDTNSNVIETSCANVFWISNDKLYTPSLEYSGVNGIVRAVILDNYPQTQIVNADIAQLYDAQSVFTCNSLMEIVPVKTIDKVSYNIESVRPIQAKIKEILRA